MDKYSIGSYSFIEKELSANAFDPSLEFLFRPPWIFDLGCSGSKTPTSRGKSYERNTFSPADPPLVTINSIPFLFDSFKKQ